MSCNENPSIICLLAGGNDVGKWKHEELLTNYDTSIDVIRPEEGIPIIFGILPRRDVGSE